MTIILNDPIQKKSVSREANERLAACKTPKFGVLSALGNSVAIYSGTNFFDPEKEVLQRIFLKTPYIRCSLWIDGEHITCLGVQI